MAFKITPFYNTDWTSIIERSMEPNVLGRADKNGNILINSSIKNSKQERPIIEHEKIHLNQIKRGDLDYDDENVYWKGKTYKRSKITEGSPALAWESEANKKSNGKKNS
jgi:hypothetical protein